MKLIRSITTGLGSIASGSSIIFSRAAEKLYNHRHYLMTKQLDGPELRLSTTFDFVSSQTGIAQFTEIVPEGFELEAIVFGHSGTAPSGMICIGTSPGGRDVVGQTVVGQGENGMFPLGKQYFGNQKQTLYLSEDPDWTSGSQLDLLFIMRDRIALIPWK